MGEIFGTSLVVQWLRIRTSSAGGMGWISGPGTKILHTHAARQKKKKIPSDQNAWNFWYVNKAIKKKPQWSQKKEVSIHGCSKNSQFFLAMVEQQQQSWMKFLANPETSR